MEPALSLYKSTQPMRLDLACGQRPREGFLGVDKYAPNVAYRVDLFQFPWPWEDNSVEEVHCSHFIEHIPMVDVTYVDGSGKEVTKDCFFAFFDELYRILRPDGVATIIWPYLKSVRAFQDPTHRRFIPLETMGYLNAEWRKNSGLDHYAVSCNFASNVNFGFDAALALRVDEVQRRVFKEAWDAIYDATAVLKPIK